MAASQSTDKKTACKSTKALGDWGAASKVAAVSGADKVPKGWATMKELSTEAFQRSLSTTNRLVMRLVREGSAESRTFRVLINGRLKVVPHYKLKSFKPSPAE